MTDASFRRFLEHSLATLRGELPTGYAVVAARLGVRAVRIGVDGESLDIRGDGTVLRLEATGDGAHAEAGGGRGTMAEILEGRLSLHQAILSERIYLGGRLDDLAAFFDALQAYFSAAVRCPSFAALLDEYLEANLTQRRRENGVHHDVA